MHHIRFEINSRICMFDHSCIFGNSEVQDAICKLKPGKNDGNVELSSNYFINACSEFSVHISLLFSCLTVHGFAPQDMLTSTVIPTPKGRNTNAADSTNYGGITLSSIFSKLFDLIILSRYGDCL
jgi:hypothetical protein